MAGFTSNIAARMLGRPDFFNARLREQRMIKASSFNFPNS